MASTYTPNRGYELQGTGDNVNTWGSVQNTNVFGLIDKNMGGVYNFSTTGGTTSISTTNAQNLSYNVSGTLTSNATIQFPNISGFYFITNGTSGAYTVTATGVNGGSVLIYAGTTSTLLLVASGVVSRALPLADAVGDMKNSVTDTSAGWLLCNGTTFGPAGSTATQLAHNVTYDLYVLQWNLGYTPVGGRGANAAADWAAAKPMPTPDFRGRVAAGRDSMGTTVAGRLTSTTISSPDSVLSSGGAQTVTLDVSQMPSHFHTGQTSVNGNHFHSQGFTAGAPAAGGANPVFAGSQTNTGEAGNHFHTFASDYTGGGGAHLNVQPTGIVNILIKY